MGFKFEADELIDRSLRNEMRFSYLSESDWKPKSAFLHHRFLLKQKYSVKFRLGMLVA